MPYKDPEKRKAMSIAAGARWRENFKATDPEGFKAYTRAARQRWAANLTDEQREAIRENQTARRRARGVQPRTAARRVALTREQFVSDLSDPRHGTANGYNNWGCRCDACRRANTVYQAEYRARRAQREARS